MMDEKEISYHLRKVEEWIGLSSQGHIFVSVEEGSRGGRGAEIFNHEAIHNMLIKTTPLGYVQQALYSFALAPFPRGNIRKTCEKLLALTVRSSLIVHEGCASFCPSLPKTADLLNDYWKKHPIGYRVASQNLDWLRNRALSAQEKSWCCIVIGRRALETPVLDDWLHKALFAPQNLEAYLSMARNSPDERFETLCKFLQRFDDSELRAWTQEAVSDITSPDVLWKFTPPNHPKDMIFRPIDPQPSSFTSFLERFVEDIMGRHEISDQELKGIDVIRRFPSIGFTPLPSAYSLVVRPRSKEYAVVYKRLPDRERLVDYDLSYLLFNPFPDEIPCITAANGKESILGEGEACLWLYSLNSPPIVCLPINEDSVRSHIQSLTDNQTLCVYDSCYDFGEGDIWFTNLVRNVPHVVLVQQAPHWLITLFSARGLRGGKSLLYHRTQLYSEVGYILFRSPSHLYPLIVLPTIIHAWEAAEESLLRIYDDMRFSLVNDLEDFLPENKLVIDLFRIITNFEGTT